MTIPNRRRRCLKQRNCCRGNFGVASFMVGVVGMDLFMQDTCALAVLLSQKVCPAMLISNVGLTTGNRHEIWGIRTASYRPGKLLHIPFPKVKEEELCHLCKSSSRDSNFHKLTSISMPYLHWETDSRRARMAEVVKEVTIEMEDKTPSIRKRYTRPKKPDLKKAKTGIFEAWQAKAKKPKTE